MSALHHALRGDEAFFKAIEAADPDTYGIDCPCGTYYVGRFSKFEPADACCPSCGGTLGSGESPALGGGPEAARVVKGLKANRAASKARKG